MNESLLEDAEVVSGVTNVLTHYFKEINTEGMSKGIIWVGHKAVVRGELISLGSKFKKASQADFNRILQALQQAALQHKHDRDPEVLKKLTELRELFLHLLDRQANNYVTCRINIMSTAINVAKCWQGLSVRDGH